MSVDEMSGVSASIRMMAGLATVEKLIGRDHARRQHRHARPQRVERGALPGNDSEVREVEDVGVAVPGSNLGKGVGTGDEHELHRRQAFGVKRLERVVGVRRSGAAYLEIGNLHTTIAIGGGIPHHPANHLDPMILGRVRAVSAMWGARRQDEANLIEAKGALRGSRGGGVTEMYRIECPAEQAHQRAHDHRLRDSRLVRGGTSAGL